MPARLVPLSDGAAAPIVLHRPVLLIGRHPECDVRLDRPQVSRRHCCLAQAYDRLVVRDLGSRNGVRVNGRPIGESQLYPGDELAIAQLIYRLEADPAASARSAEPAPPVSDDDGDLPDFGLLPLDD
jgi:predicted component of type VI protein secretion system